MTDTALVIGLDYDNPAWELRAAVRDALAFADWVTAPGAGRATPETLTLLLAPHPSRPVVGRDFKPADLKTIERALFDHKKLDATKTNRLWFFYAGHGLAPAGGGPDEAPVVVPSDVDDLEFYRNRPIDLGSWIREMQVCAPEFQLYFVDACRGLVVSEDVVTSRTTLFFDLSKMKHNGQARQAVLFATTAGQLANEQGLHGLFGGALLDGLRGTGPVLDADPATREFFLTFGGLAAYTKRCIQLLSEEARRQQKMLPTQEPAESLFRTQSSLEIARFTKKPRSRVRVFVKPDEATDNGTAGIRAYNEWTASWERQAEQPSPLGVPVEWELSSTVYQIEIEAHGFENWSKKIDVIGPMEIRAELVERPVVEPQNAGLEALGPESVEAPPPDGAELAAGRHGTIQVRAHDRYARIEVFDGANRRVAQGWQRLDELLPVGAYRIEVSLPTERPTVRSILLTAGELEEVEVAPDAAAAAVLAPMLQAAHMGSQGGFASLSEQFGETTMTHFGSLLAWGAWAAQFPDYDDGHTLRSLGVQRVPQAPGACFVQVLVGDVHPHSPNPQGGPLATLQLLFEQNQVAVQPLPALQPFAVQWFAPVTHATSVMVSTGGLNPKRIPIPHVPDHVWVIVIAREASGATEIHRYLNPLIPHHPFDDTVRLVEQSWRAFDTRTPLFDGEAERLLGRDLDPLALAVLGFRLAREERWADVKAVVDRLGPIELVDKHVLAALASPMERAVHMERAVGSPTVPVVGEGYRLMEEWLVSHFASKGMPPPVAPEPFTGGLWTTFDTRGTPVVSKAFPVDGAPAWASSLVQAARATARIEPAPGAATPFLGTGFLIGPRALVTTDFMIQQGPHAAQFVTGRAVIEQIVAKTDDERHGALARIEALAAPPAPLKIRWQPPEVGQRIAVIGHPMLDARTPTLATISAFTMQPAGDKMIMPGVIIAVEDTKLTYECWTMGGVAGGPILDLATGEVIGVHHSGKYMGGTKKLGFGVPVTAIRALLETPV